MAMVEDEEEATAEMAEGAGKEPGDMIGSCGEGGTG